MLELAVVIPTFNEIGNVEELVRRLEQALAGINWEVVFVDDDSSDGTAARLQAIATTDARVRCLRRVGRRGLSSACVEGMLATGAAYIAVMDADLQHDEALLPAMLQALREVDDALAELDSLALGKLVSQRRVEATTAWWTYLPPFANKSAADKRASELKAAGLKEFSFSFGDT